MGSRTFTVCKACSAFCPPSATWCHRCEAPLSQNQRQFGRVDVNIGAIASSPPGGPFDVEVKNISMGGLLLRSDRPYQIKDILCLQLPLEGELFKIEAEVRHVEEDFTAYLIGVEFSTMSPQFIFKVHDLLMSAGVA